MKTPKSNSALVSWKQLNREISKLSESELEQLLELERANKRRPMMIRRLHQRLSKLRVAREREQLRKDP